MTNGFSRKMYILCVGEKVYVEVLLLESNEMEKGCLLLISDWLLSLVKWKKIFGVFPEQFVWLGFLGSHISQKSISQRKMSVCPAVLILTVNSKEKFWKLDYRESSSFVYLSVLPAIEDCGGRMLLNFGRESTKGWRRPDTILIVDFFCMAAFQPDRCK